MGDGSNRRKKKIRKDYAQQESHKQMGDMKWRPTGEKEQEQLRKS